MEKTMGSVSPYSCYFSGSCGGRITSVPELHPTGWGKIAELFPLPFLHLLDAILRIPHVALKVIARVLVGPVVILELNHHTEALS